MEPRSSMHPQVHDRREAGSILARKLMHAARDQDVIVLALPRGGIPVAFEVAMGIHAPLDVFVVRWLGYPGHEEVPVGAIAQGGLRVMNQSLIRALQAKP